MNAPTADYKTVLYRTDLQNQVFCMCLLADAALENIILLHKLKQSQSIL